MSGPYEAQTLKEIRRRALQRADTLRQERQMIAKTQHTLDALQEVTGLHRNELEAIADAVTRSVQGAHDDFFSVKMQILISFGVLSLIIIFGGLVASI
ncbi:MAG: hypothetical protein R3274_00910 [Desulfobacterales bacterium]|nr:hypothetical protein [Desulfobacterales bacterium]